MNRQRIGLFVGLWLVLAFPLVVQVERLGASPVAVPSGTTLDSIRLSDDARTELSLKPAEQVAFLFTQALWSLEQKCSSDRSGVGHLVPLAELVKGIELPDGSSVGLSQDPGADASYRYEVMNIATYCIITALPTAGGLGGFAIVGTSGTFGRAEYYWIPAGAGLAEAQKLSELGYSGTGFRR